MTSSLKVLVAGGAGYIGTHMVKALLEAGHHPVTVDNLCTGHRELLPGGEFIRADIADTDRMKQVFQIFEFDAVMHFAAFIEVGESVSDPLKYYRNNVAATANLLHCMLHGGLRRFIFSSSAAVYGKPRYTPVDEDHPLAPVSPYGRSKQHVETMLEDCAAAHGLQYVSLRYFNAAGADASATIGERHRPESHLIPLVLDAASGKREDIKIFGTDYATPDGTCIRDYVHVNDLARAHLLALENLMSDGGCRIYNLGNSVGHSVRQVVDTAAEVTGKTVKVTPADRRPGDPAVLVAASQKIKTELNWKPQYEELGRIIRTAWNWHRKACLAETGAISRPLIQ